MARHNSKGLGEILVNFDKLIAKEQDIIRAVKRSGTRIVRNAKQRAPVDEGDLRASIHMASENGGLVAAVGTNREHAPYREFGTGKQVDVPGGYEQQAKQYKGNGGFPPPGVLLGWMRRHGIPETAEFAIRKSIYENGTKPQPFLIPSFEEEKPKFHDDLKKVLGDL